MDLQGCKHFYTAFQSAFIFRTCGVFEKLCLFLPTSLLLLRVFPKELHILTNNAKKANTKTQGWDEEWALGVRGEIREPARTERRVSSYVKDHLGGLISFSRRFLFQEVLLFSEHFITEDENR